MFDCQAWSCTAENSLKLPAVSEFEVWKCSATWATLMSADLSLAVSESRALCCLLGGTGYLNVSVSCHASNTGANWLENTSVTGFNNFRR